MNAGESPSTPKPPTPAAPSVSVSPPRRMKGWLSGVLGPFLALGAVFLFFAVADGMVNEVSTFTDSRNLTTIATHTASVAVAALGMTLIIISGGIDLSAGTALALSATVLAWCLLNDVAATVTGGENAKAIQQRMDEARRELKSAKNKVDDDTLAALETRIAGIEAEQSRYKTLNGTLAIAAAVLTGCATGFLNGLLISSLRVIPFIVTLGTMTVYLGLAKTVANETTVRPNVLNQVPDWISELLTLRSDSLYLGVPTGVWFVLFLSVLLSLMLRYTVFGRYVFALGSNESTARLCGVNVPRNKIAVYTLAGLFVGIAGVYQFSRLKSGNPTSGTGMELEIIAAVVIGGGSLSGGRGSVLGTLTGATIMVVIKSGCVILGLKNPMTDMILGVIIVMAVVVDQLRQRRLQAG